MGCRNEQSGATHARWVAAVRPCAERTIDEIWREGHRYAVLDRGPRQLDVKGRSVAGAVAERNAARLRRFYELRGRISAELASGELSLSQARERLAGSEFARDMRIAGSREEAA